MTFSIIIPAHDEERWLGGGIAACREAQARHGGTVEIIVVLNRCTDRTEVIARAAGAVVVREDARNLAKIRNAGARVARHEVLITVDADSRMHPDTLVEVERALASGRYIGGGVPIRPERRSLGIRISALCINLMILPLGISAGLFWCWRRDFEAIGGFDERKVIAEDVDFALRLKTHGRAQGKRFGTLRRVPIITSCRKFDRFGDWFAIRMLLRHPLRLHRALHAGDHAALADKFFYDFKH
jgi:glycosyltransferase involved in cell wall biosynthesis